MEPILHLSLPVRDLDESRAFYVDVLGCGLGRVRPDFVDVWLYGMQLTLQHNPEQVLADEQRGVRHFGVTLGAAELAELLARLDAHAVRFLRPLCTDHPGTPREQTKAKILDPSGNVIELKSYATPPPRSRTIDASTCSPTRNDRPSSVPGS